MGPALALAAAAREMAFCGALGAAAGAVRALLPLRGRGAFLPDLLFVGGLLLALQSYGAALSLAGELRGYMVLAAFCAAGLAQRLLGPAAALARGWVCRRGAGLLQARPRPPKPRRSEKTPAEKTKKSLPTPRPMLYNSNVSK